MPYLLFSAKALRRIADGRKRATIAPRQIANKFHVGQVIVFRAVGCTATVQVRIAAVQPVPDLVGVPAAAEAAGLTLDDFTKLRSWHGYLACMPGTRRAKGMAMVVFDALGAVSGELPVTPNRVRKSPDSVQGRPWRRASTTDTSITPATDIHPADRAELRDRLQTAIHNGHATRGFPPRTPAVVDALAAAGTCTGRPSRAQTKRLELTDNSIDTALAWLAEHGLVVDTGTETVLAPRILQGLRVLH